MDTDVAADSIRRRFDWNLLHTYLVIVRQRSITGAAEKLRLQQPTVSNALKRLETQLGTHLVDRTAGHFELTAQGRVLFEQCQDICGSIARLDQLLADTRYELDGHLRIYLASHVVFAAFDQALAEFHRMHPRATLEIEIETSP